MVKSDKQGDKKPSDTAKSPTSVVQKAEVSRAKWGNEVQFVLSCVGYSVGLGNVWRFPNLVYQNGGGAFLIPYAIKVVIAGLPLYVLELALGQFGNLGPTTVFRRVAPLFQVCVSFNVTMYYNMILAWVIYYMFQSFRVELPWLRCNQTWNNYKCVSKTDDAMCAELLNFSDARFFARRCYSSSQLDDPNPSFEDWQLFDNVTLNGSIRNMLMHMDKHSPARQFFRYNMLQKPDHIDLYELDTMNGNMVGCLAAAWALVFACLFGGVQTSGKVVYFTALFPYVVLFIMLCRGATLDGAGEGILYYVTLNITTLIDPNVWRFAAVQVFYSLSPAQDGLITLASYNEFTNDFVRDALIVTAVDSLTSSFAGFTTFSIIGYVAHIQGQAVKDAATGGPGLVFEAFPQAIATLPAAPFWSIMFFIMLLTLGLDSQTVTTAIMDQFPVLAKRKAIVTGLGCVFCFLLGLPYCTQDGVIVFEIFDNYASGYVVLMLALYQTVVVAWVYGLGKFLKDINRMIGRLLNYYWRITWAFITPLYMTTLFVAALIYYEPAEYYDGVLPKEAQTVGWVLSSTPMLALLGFATYRIVEAWKKKLPWESLITPTTHWCPAADLAKRSPARHEGSTRLHLLDHPHREHAKAEVEMSDRSKLKSTESGSAKSSSMSSAIGLW